MADPYRSSGEVRKDILATIPAERWPYAVTTALHPTRSSRHHRAESLGTPDVRKNRLRSSRVR